MAIAIKRGLSDLLWLNVDKKTQHRETSFYELASFLLHKPDSSIDKISKVTGMNITIVIDSNSDKDSFELLKAFGMPFISRN